MKELLPATHFCLRNLLNCGVCHSGNSECHRHKSDIPEPAVD